MTVMICPSVRAAEQVMMRSVCVAILVSLLCLPALAQQVGRMTIDTGGETHEFSATGAWQDAYGLSAPALRIQIGGEHPDGTTMTLDFTATGGRVSEVVFRFREPDTTDVYGREWIEGPGFRVTLSELRRTGDVVVVSGRFRGLILDPHTPGGRARVGGSFAVDLVEPIYSPN